MDAAIAESIVHETREQAAHTAHTDLKQQCRNAAQAGREESRRLIKTSRIDRNTGEIHFNLASRLLRDWSFHVYLNTLRDRLGQPADHIDAQQVEDTTSQLHHLTDDIPAIRALQAVGVVRRTAEDDAAHATLAVVSHLHTLGSNRAIAEIPDGRFDADPARVHVTRHWFLRCYLEHIERATATLAPLAEITDAEEGVVAQTLQTGTMRRVIGRDGIPLITRHGMLLNDIDRRLASGETYVVPANIAIEEAHTGWTKLGSLVRTAWRASDPDGRAAWVAQSGARDVDTQVAWRDLHGDQQSALIRRYLAVNRSDIIGQVFDRPPLRGEPADAARRMFNHPAILSRDGHLGTPTSRDVEPVRQAAIQRRPYVHTEGVRPLR